MKTAEYESQCTGAKKEEDNNNNDKNLQRKVQMLLKPGENEMFCGNRVAAASGSPSLTMLILSAAASASQLIYSQRLERAFFRHRESELGRAAS